MNKTDKTTKKNTTKRPGKCAHIDGLLLQGGYTLRQIAEMTHKKFGGSLKSTLATVNARPWHLRAAGKKPKWETETAKEAK